MNGEKQQAQFLLQRPGRAGTAEELLRQRLAVDPDDAEAYALLGQALAERGAWEEAEAAAGTAVWLAPESSEAHGALGMVRLRSGDGVGAERAAQDALRLEPGEGHWWALVAAARAAREAWAEMLTAADRAIVLEPASTWAGSLRGFALLQLGRRDEAANAFTRVVREDPEEVLAHSGQGWVLLHRGQPHAASEHFRIALRLDPTDEWAREGLLEALRARNPAYRLLLGYTLRMSRLPHRIRIAVAGSGLMLFRLLPGPLAALYLLVVVMLWLGQPLANLGLRLGRDGRMLLSREETTAANWLGGWLAGTAAVGILGAVLTSSGVLLAAAALLVTTLLLTRIWEIRPGRTRQLVTAGTVLCGGLAGLSLLLVGVGAAGVPTVGAMAPLAAFAGLGLAVFGMFALNLLHPTGPRS